MTINFGQILLGALNGLFLQGVKSGPPDHLQVLTDTTITRTESPGCGQRQKFIGFRIVDASNQPAGRVAISEAPQPTLIDSCSNTHPGLSIACSSAGVGDFGNFQDILNTGCPTIGGSCGFSLGDTWRWCSAYDGSVCKNLAWMFYDVHYDHIKVDNEENLTLLQYKY